MSHRKLGNTLLSGLLLIASVDLKAERLVLIDAHSHHEEQYRSEFSCQDIVATLDRTGVEKILLTSLSNASTLECSAHAPTRVVPFYSVYDNAVNKQNWMHQAAVVARATEALQTGRYAGIGELHIFARDSESPVLRGLVELARNIGLPLLLHADAEVIERVFAIDPQAQVLWAHLGTVPEIAILQRLLDRYPQGLFIDTSVREGMLLGNRVVNGPKRDALAPEWREFFITNSKRILVAVDTYSLNRWQGYDQVAEQIRLWLSQLPHEVATRLAHSNAQRFFGERGSDPD